jgi:archaellum component FlaC
MLDERCFIAPRAEIVAQRTRRRAFRTTRDCFSSISLLYTRAAHRQRTRLVPRSRKGVGMPRAKEEPRGRLAALQDMFSGGSQALLDQAQSLRDGLQKTLGDVASGLEEQMATVVDAVDVRLSTQLDELVSGLAVSIRKDVDRIRERVRALETRMSDVPREGVREFVNPLQTLANNAIQTATAVQTRIEELVGRLALVERRTAEVVTPDPQEAMAPDDVRARLDRIESRLADLSREAGGKLGEVGAVRERLTRIENRVLETSKEQIARAGEATGLRDRLARLEARLSDLSREQVARAVEAAGLRERVFRLEQRTVGIDGGSPRMVVAERAE